jgi:anti-sigma factor RsiW
MTMAPSDRRRRRSEEHLTDAELNELVDRTLSATDTERAQEHLATCPDCDERYRTLLATISALKSAPSVMPRRSFQLTPAQAKLPAKPPSWLDRFSEWIVPGVPAIRAATLAVALLLLSVTAIDVITHRSETSENAGPAVMRQAEPTQQATPAQANGAVPTSIPAEQETDTGLTTANQPEAASGGAPAATDESGPMVSGAMQSGDTSEAASDGTAPGAASGNAEEIPPAPAAAMPQQEPSQVLGEESESMAEVAPEASPTSAPTETATPSPSPMATASPVPPSPTAAPSPTPAERTNGNGASVSRWRIAEFGLLLLLVWFGVTWFGRTRVGNRSNTDETDAES